MGDPDHFEPLTLLPTGSLEWAERGPFSAPWVLEAKAHAAWLPRLDGTDRSRDPPSLGQESHSCQASFYLPSQRHFPEVEGLTGMHC